MFKLAKLFLLMVGGTSTICCFGAGLEISPIRITLSPETPIVALTITNQTPEEVLIQASIKHWRQTRGEDVYHSQQQLLITPIMTKIPAHKSQIFRIATIKPLVALDNEDSYRAFFEEVPSKQNPNALNFSLRVGIPIFIPPKKSTKESKLVWSIKKNKKHFHVTAFNPSNQHIQIHEININDFKTSVFKYLLPQQRYTWQFELPSKKVKTKPWLKLIARTDQGDLSSRVSTT